MILILIAVLIAAISICTGQMIWPVDGPVSQEFGVIGVDGLSHDGIDIGAPCDTDVIAAASGTVEDIRNDFVGTYSGTDVKLKSGNYVVIKDDSGKIWEKYLHLQTGSVMVAKGDHVSQGDLIGAVGNTGYSTGCHLHFGVITGSRYGTPVDPEIYLDSPSTPNKVQLLLHMMCGCKGGADLPGVKVTGQDASGVPFDVTTDVNGDASIEGSPGKWHFEASKEGYVPSSWDKEVTKSDTNYPYLLNDNTAWKSKVDTAGPLSDQELASIVMAVFPTGDVPDKPGESIRATAYAVAWAESNGHPTVWGDRNVGDSLGLWQINLCWNPDYKGHELELFDPEYNAEAALAISNGGTNWIAWSTWKKGTYTKYLDDAQAAFDKLGEGCGSLTSCEGECVDTQTDPSNCGSCGKVCASGKTCVNGACKKMPGLCIQGHCYDISNGPKPLEDWEIILKDGAGAEIASTTTNVDGSYSFCGLKKGDYEVSEVLKEGWISFATDSVPVTLPWPDTDTVMIDFLNEPCQAGLKSCNGECVDLTSDTGNCGACGNACADGQSCCDGTCIDTQSNAQNCGDCGNACRAGHSCVSSNCETCDDGIQNGDETDVDCGGSCPACPTDECVADNCDNGHVDHCDDSCGGPFGTGHCFTTTEGFGVCLANYYCGSGSTCTSSADCGDGVCVTGDCCGYNECRPASDFCSAYEAPMNAEMPTTLDGSTGAWSYLVCV
jgi:hypothetical protein